MDKKSAEKEKFDIRQFRDKSSNFWCNNKHYNLNESNHLVFISGGIEDLKETEEMQAYIKRNKKTFKSREKSPLNDENAPQIKCYNEILRFGKHSGKSVEEVMAIDKKWLIWCRDNYNFNSAQEKLKQEITEILKK